MPKCWSCKEERALLVSGLEKERSHGLNSSVAVCEKKECRDKVDFIRKEE